MARSEDGGATFTNSRISETTFTPRNSVFFGDCINVAAFDGKVYPIWTRMDSTLLSVWTPLVEEPVGMEPYPDPSILGTLRSPRINPIRSTRRQ